MSQELLDFLNLRAQATEASTEKKSVSKPINSMVISTTFTDNCISCGLEKHQLYACAQFHSLPYSQKIELLRSKNHCLMVETLQGVFKALALLDTGSSASFITERLAFIYVDSLRTLESMV